MYRGGSPPWDIGRPQGPFLRLAESGKVKGSVLDVGCGTGEHVLLFASRGNEAWGIDGAPTAVEKARAKSKKRGIAATFVLGSVLDLEPLGRTFDNVIDSGLFHTLSDSDRKTFARSLSAVLAPRGHYYMMCFSEHEPSDEGPRRVTQAEIRKTFAKDFEVQSIAEARFEHFINRRGAAAWFAHLAKRA